jgi:Mg/Co/Ni transporter MgtE
MSAELLHARRAALLLHGLDAPVRTAVLARLRPEEFARVRSLLDELAELGVPRSLGEELSAAAFSALERVARMRPQDIASTLQHCSVATAACLLEARKWPWREAVLDYLPEQRRAAIRLSMQSTQSRLAASALEALCEQLLKQTRWTR